MKKFFSMFFTAAICLCICSCGKQSEYDLSFWRQPKESKTVQPFVERGNMVTTVADGTDTGGVYIAQCIDKLTLTPAENINLEAFDIPQLVYQLNFIKYHGENVGGWMPQENYEYVYIFRFYNDFQYVAVFSDAECKNMITPVYTIEDSAEIKEYFINSALYVTDNELTNIKGYMNENFSGKDREYLQQFFSDGTMQYWLDYIPQDIVFTPDYSRMWTVFRNGELSNIAGFMNFREDLYSYIIFFDTGENGEWIVQNMMLMLYEDNPQA